MLAMNGKITCKQDEQIRCISKCASKEQGIDDDQKSQRRVLLMETYSSSCGLKRAASWLLRASSYFTLPDVLLHICQCFSVYMWRNLKVPALATAPSRYMNWPIADTLRCCYKPWDESSKLFCWQKREGGSPLTTKKCYSRDQCEIGAGVRRGGGGYWVGKQTPL